MSSRRGRRGARLLIFAAPGVAAVVGLLALGAHWRTHVTVDLGRARDLHGSKPAGAAACARCHPEHFASWKRTFHRTMTADVSPARADAVAGDFSGATYRYDGVLARMFRDEGGRFLMEFTLDGAPAMRDRAPPVRAEVVRAVGSRRYQQYFASVAGALWRLPLAFHVEEQRWFHMNGAFLTPDPAAAGEATPDRGGQPSSRRAAGQRPSSEAPPRFGGGDYDRHVTRWNDNCVFCHNVAPNPGRDPQSGQFRTTVGELGVACEACHGPGDEHARLNQDPLRRYLIRHLGAPDPTIVNPSRLSPSRAADVCGRCHGQRITDDIGSFLARGDPFVPGEDLALYSAPLWRDTTLAGQPGVFAARFWADGTPRLTAYEYQGLLQSACAQRGSLTCTSCHGMHDGDPRGQVRPAASGDRACTAACHVELGAPAAAARHARHDPAGPGGRCVSCHMPRLVYGVLDVHPSHRIEIPDPARAIAYGRPDACTLCHVENDRDWAVRERRRLWPVAGDGGAGAASSEARRAPADDALAPLAALFTGDPIARAVAADALGRAAPPSASRSVPPGGGAVVESVRAAALLQAIAIDRYPAVRHLAARSLAALLEGRSPAGAQACRAYDATAPAPERALHIARIRRAGGIADLPEATARIATLQTVVGDPVADIEIGE